MQDDQTSNENDTRELTAIERMFGNIARLSAFAALFLYAIFTGYVIVGIGITYGLPGTLPYVFLSFEGDPVFVSFGTVVGTLLCLSGVCSTAYALLSPIDTNRAVMAVITGMTAVGFGLATIRLTLDPLINHLMGLGV